MHHLMLLSDFGSNHIGHSLSPMNEDGAWFFFIDLRALNRSIAHSYTVCWPAVISVHERWSMDRMTLSASLIRLFLFLMFSACCDDASCHIFNNQTARQTKKMVDKEMYTSTPLALILHCTCIQLCWITFFGRLRMVDHQYNPGGKAPFAYLLWKESNRF